MEHKDSLHHFNTEGKELKTKVESPRKASKGTSGMVIKFPESKKLYYRRQIEPWPMPCKDGDQTICLPDRTALKRQPQSTSEPKKQSLERTDPYHQCSKVGKIKSKPCGLLKYRMVEYQIPSKRLLCKDPHGNIFQLAPGPRYNPFD
ncbi:hypothetical protein JTE90_014319 [Oedothorax gibbosus]|uniref:Uncharacterized protein n=1 Tax=Oedothorax gibbosus TaxID=931172 RepID=A0AAV6UX84_9ARAC|nr:hypothetical protein JTE90_014319 [Oedothorax gibbosus]